MLRVNLSHRLIALLSIVFVLSIPACSRNETKKTTESEARLVKTMLVTPNQNSLNRAFPGKVFANLKVDLSFQISGKLIELPVTEGMLVKKNQLLARLDPRDYDISLANAKAKYDHAKSLLARLKKLLDVKHVSEADYDKKKMEMEVSLADLNKAQKDLSDTYLYAPFEGLIARKYVENFQYINAKGDILSLQDNAEIEIKVNLSEQDITLLGGLTTFSADVQDKKVVGNASFATIANKEFPVALKQFATVADPQTQTYLVTLIMPKTQNSSILPGMTASVRFKNVHAGKKNITIPLSAVGIDANGSHYVWVIDQTSMQAVKRVVSVGEIAGKNIFILKGLQPGDVIVTAGINQIVDGMKVRIMPEMKPAGSSE